MKVIHVISKILVIIGALNWGLVGIFNYDVVADIFGGPMAGGAKIVYTIIGLAGLLCIFCWFRHCCCHSGSSCGSGKGCGKCGSSGCHCGSSCKKD